MLAKPPRRASLVRVDGLLARVGSVFGEPCGDLGVLLTPDSGGRVGLPFPAGQHLNCGGPVRGQVPGGVFAALGMAPVTQPCFVDVAYDGANIWVANVSDNTVSRIVL